MTPQELHDLFEPLYGEYGLAIGLARDTGYSESQIRNLLKGRQPIKKHVEHHFRLWADRLTIIKWEEYAIAVA